MALLRRTLSNTIAPDLAAAINCPIGPLMSYKFALNSLSVFNHSSPKIPHSWAISDEEKDEQTSVSCMRTIQSEGHIPAPDLTSSDVINMQIL